MPGWNDTHTADQYDQYAKNELGLPLVSFRPQYIYGPKSNKYDYIDWYFDRLVRNLPLPIPGDGSQMVSLTNSEDVASLLASPLNNEAAAVEQFATGFERVDWLINAAGALHIQGQGPEKSIMAVTDTHLLASIQINTLPTLTLARCFSASLYQRCSCLQQGLGDCPDQWF